MAALNELIQKIENPELRAQIQAAADKLVKQKKFGLVFEEHLPECTPLYDIPVRKGAKVSVRNGKANEIYTVLKIEDGIVTCLPKNSKEAVQFAIDDLVTTAELGDPKITNILNNVSKKSSEYLRKVWKDYKNVSFELRINGENIDIHIKDANNFYDCEQRSDGFKRFVTFLLALSAPVNNGEISNAIIIIDEPDTGIHIKGQKNLMQELIRISKNNLVFYSTHSIFMIDREDPSRHFIVSKTNEVSKISQVTSSNYTDDEVLFNALGYSIFETLKPKNIIFEGWADKKLFITALASTKGKALTGLKDFGYVHASGVKTIIGVAKDLELANRAYVVISDSDGPAKQKRREYDEKEICTGEWYAYDELMPEIYTLEDFIKHSALKKAILKIAEKYPELQEFNVENIDGVKYKREERIKEGILAVIKDKQKCPDIMKEIKSEIYSNVTTRDIEDEYFEFLKALDEKIVPRD